MAAVLYWVGIGLGALLTLVLALLVVPVDLRARIAAEAALSWTVQIRWLFGLIRIERGSAPRRAAGREAAEPKPAAPEGAAPPVSAERGAAGGRRRRTARGIPGFVTEPVVWRRAARTLRALLRGLKLRRADAHIRFGLDDPADTGRLYGMLAPAAILLQSMSRARVLVEPDFERAGVAGRAAGELRIVPLRVLAPLVSFGLWLGLRSRRNRNKRRPQ